MQICTRLSSPLNFSHPPQFSRKYARFSFPLLFSRTQAASMLQWSRRPCRGVMSYTGTVEGKSSLVSRDEEYCREGLISLPALSSGSSLHVAGTST